jgi:hypothetical protein
MFTGANLTIMVSDFDRAVRFNTETLGQQPGVTAISLESGDMPTLLLAATA